MGSQPKVGMVRRHRVRRAIGVFAVFLAATASAQTRYPWDTGTVSCSMPPASTTAACLQANWPDFPETSQRLQQLVLSRQFALLERALTDISQSASESPSGRPLSYSAFASLLAFATTGAPGVTPSQLAQAWRAAVPGSHFLPVIDALALRERAWKIRGSATGAQALPESEQLFATRLASADRVLLEAPPELKQFPLWHHVLLVIALDSRKLQTDAPSEFHAAVKRWPRYFPFYVTVLARMTPNQGGNWEFVEWFVDTWARQSAATEGSSMYARLYVELIGYGKDPIPRHLDWGRMKASFADLMARYPDPEFKHAFAAYACRAADRLAFRRAIANIAPDQLPHIEWLHGYSYAACMKWYAG